MKEFIFDIQFLAYKVAKLKYLLVIHLTYPFSIQYRAQYCGV